MTNYKKYHIPIIYRGYQVFLMCCANSYKKAAEKFGTTMSYTRSYAGCVKADENDVYFDDVIGYIDSGYIIFKFDRYDLARKEMPYDDLKKIINEYIKKKYENNF